MIPEKKEAFYSQRSTLIVLLISIVYMLSARWLVGFKTDQLFLAAIFILCFFLSHGSRKFIVAFSIFIVYWILYDYMKAFPNFNYNTVHIQDLYEAEKSLFPIKINGKIITANEYWLQNGNNLLDVLSGIFYLCWIPVPLAFAVFLFFKDKKTFLEFSLTFVLVNLIGFIVYYTYPAAPPWYYQQHGNNFIAGTMGNTAGLYKFDDHFNIHIFRNIYQKGSNVFAAMPSLHSAYPLIVVFYGLKKKLWFINLLFIVVTLGIWFAAVYTSHHYILDVLAGIVCAATGIFIFQKILLRSKGVNRFLNFYQKAI